MNGLLLDTHVLLWWLQDNRRLGTQAKALIRRSESLVFVSAATAWEIAIKVGLGRLDLGEPPDTCVPRELDRNGFRPLRVTVAHALALTRLPPHHQDPFDRLLVAQSILDGLSLMTADSALAEYGVAIVDARR